jgi:hypothetical protein
VGIGNWDIIPLAKLQVEDGDIYISDINKGIIMTSPNGQCWRGTVDNSGSLAFTAVSCPSGSATKSTVHSQEWDVQVYPNPVESLLNIHVNEQIIDYLHVEVYDFSGKMVYMREYRSGEFQISTRGLASGSYILRIRDQEGHIVNTEKFFKQ